MTTRSYAKPAATAVLIASVLSVTYGLNALLPEVFEPLAGRATDALFWLRSRVGLAPEYDRVVVHVDIDDASVEQHEDYYIDRTDHAALIRGLKRAGVAVQFHDLMFRAPISDDQDRDLEQAIAEAGNVYLGMAVGLSAGRHAALGADRGPERRWTRDAPTELLDVIQWEVPTGGAAATFPEVRQHVMTFPALARQARGHGFLDLVPEGGSYRRLPLMARDGDRMIPSAALLVAADYLGLTPERIEIGPRSVTLEDARRPGGESMDIVIPTDRQGRMIVNYIGDWNRMSHYAYSVIDEASGDRFMMEDLREEMQGRIAVVSWVTTGSGDIGAVPTDALFPLAGVHANAIHTILTQGFLRDLTWWEGLLAVELPLMVLLFLAAMRLRPIPFLVSAIFLAVLFHTVVALAFLRFHLILDVPRPMIALLGSSLLVAAFNYHLESNARAVLRHTFDAFFPPSVVDKIIADPTHLSETAQKKVLTILFSDIKSFTHHSAEMDAAKVRELLNEYFERMIDIVFRHEGTLDKFIGDGLMVFFGDPQPQPDHATRCVRAALEMQAATRKLNATWKARGDMPLEIRIGINTGSVVVGNMGSERRLSYTVLGEAVNLAQRLESNAPVNGILIADSTQQLLEDDVPTRRVEPIMVKGFDHPIAVHEVIVRESPDRTH